MGEKPDSSNVHATHHFHTQPLIGGVSVSEVVDVRTGFPVKLTLLPTGSPYLLAEPRLVGVVTCRPSFGSVTIAA